MAKLNSKKIGNKFQEDFEESIPENLYYTRYKDSPTQYKKVHNEGDYLVNAGKFICIVENKTTKGKSLPLGNIGMEQVWKMLCATCKLNTFGGFLINFRDLDETYFVFVTDFLYWYLNRTSQSIPIEWVKNNGYRVSQKIRIKRFRYGVLGLLNYIEECKYVNEVI